MFYVGLVILQITFLKVQSSIGVMYIQDKHGEHFNIINVRIILSPCILYVQKDLKKLFT